MKISELRNQKPRGLKEHITKYPRTKEDFKSLETLLSSPIAGEEGLRMVTSLIQDTALTDVLKYELSLRPDFVMNDVVIDWVKANMPHVINGFEPTDSYYSPLSNLNKDV